MSKFRKISGLFVVGVKDLRWTKELTSFLKDYPVGGLALFNSPFDHADNIWRDREGSLELVYDFSRKALSEISFLSADQEGGRVRRLRGAFLPLPSAKRFADACENSPSKLQKAEQILSLAAEQMALSGIHLNFAPVCDLATETSHEVVGDRSFGKEPAAVISWAQRFCKAFESKKVHTTLKHFPGHGSSQRDSHEEIAVLEKEKRAVMAEDMKIFQEVAPHTSAVMTAHIAFADSPDRIFSLDAALISEFKSHLPASLHWITDDLQGMKAVSERKPWIRAFEAGYDHILLCGDLHGAAKGIEETIRFAESQKISFVQDQSLDRKIENSRKKFFHPLEDLSFRPWKSLILEKEAQGLQLLEELHLGQTARS